MKTLTSFKRKDEFVPFSTEHHIALAHFFHNERVLTFGESAIAKLIGIAHSVVEGKMLSHFGIDDSRGHLERSAP